MSRLLVLALHRVAHSPHIQAQAALLVALACGCEPGASRTTSDAGGNLGDVLRDAAGRDSGSALDNGDAALGELDADSPSDLDAAALFDGAITGADAAIDVGWQEGPLAWESTTTTLTDADVIVEKVVYLSEGLRVFGQVCRPNPTGSKGAGPFPVSILNHGGFSGLSDWNGGTCVDNARKGWVAAESSYRGEDGSEGKIEVCLGEVTDVLRLTAVVLAQPYADPKHVYMSGVSHGGCITTRAVQRGAPVQLAIDIFGPTDWAEAYASWQSAIAAGSPLTANYQALKSTLDQAVGGGPEQFPVEYARRSPRFFAADLDRANLPFLVLQGVADAYVPPAQACELAAASKRFQSFHVATSGAVLQTPPTGCEQAGLTWLAGPRPSSSWPADRYLMVYEDVGHNFEGSGASALFTDMLAFLVARFPK